MEKHFDCLILCHLFYRDEVADTISELKTLNETKECLFLFNIAFDDNKAILEDIRKTFVHFRAFSFPNKGRDIGAKLYLLNAAIRLNVSADYCFIVHDKKSPHLRQNNDWRKDLLSIVSKKKINEIDSIFLEQQEVGIIASKKYIQNEWDDLKKGFGSNNAEFLKKVIEEVNISTHDYSFVAGNIFLTRYRLLHTFFSRINIIEIIQSLESENALDFLAGTRIHSWERMMCWIITSQGYSIYGL